jgi:hypothetical protein
MGMFKADPERVNKEMKYVGEEKTFFFSLFI